jgi:hypothetical protein
MAVSLSYLLPTSKFQGPTTSDAGWFFGLTEEIVNNNGMEDRYMLSHPPQGQSTGVSVQGQPVIAAMLYKGLSAINPNITVEDVARYLPPIFFILMIIPVFLIGRELFGDIGGCAAAFFLSIMACAPGTTSPVYWAKVGAFDHDVLDIMLAAWTIFLTIKLFKAPRESILKFSIIGGLVYGVLGFVWGGGYLYLAVIIFAALISVILNESFTHKRGGWGLKAIWDSICRNSQLIFGTSVMLSVAPFVIWLIGGGSNIPLMLAFAAIAAFVLAGRYFGIKGMIVVIAVACVGVFFVRTSLIGFVSGSLEFIGLGTPSVTIPKYASEMTPVGAWGDALSGYYGAMPKGVINPINNITTGDCGAILLTTIVFLLVAVALIKIIYTRKRGELLMMPWLVVLVLLANAQSRFLRQWWPLLAILAGVGAASIVIGLKRLSISSFGPSIEAVNPIRRPVAIALIICLVATPYIINARAQAENTGPPIGDTLQEGIVDAALWAKENTPDNSIFAIQWSYGHLFTATARRPSVVDGTETTGFEGEWENTATIRPPDYIYRVVDHEAQEIGGRRPDVQRLVSEVGEDEFRQIINTYRDNYNCKIDYVIFDASGYSYGRDWLNWTPANMLLSAVRKATLQSPWSSEAQGYVFNFGENRENVVLDTQTMQVYLRTGDLSETLDGYAVFTLNAEGTNISNFSGFNPPSSTPDFPESLLIFLDENSQIAGAWLVESVSAEISALPTPMSVRIFEGDVGDISYLRIAYTSSNGWIKVVQINYVPSLTSPVDRARINDNTPTFNWSSAIGAEKYELWVDNNPDFSSPEVLENIAGNTHTSTSALVDGTYYWKVRALGAENEELGWASTWTFTIDTVQPAAPMLVSPEDNQIDNVMTKTFTWAQPEPDATYRLQISTTASFDQPYFYDNSSIVENSYSFIFTAGGTYYWRVRAMDVAGNWGAWSENSKLTITAPPGAPQLNTPENEACLSENTLILEWVAGFYADNHRLLVDNDPDFSSPEVDNLFGLEEAWMVGPLADDNYYWKVVGINAWGENSSPVWMFTVDTTPPSAPALVSPTNGLHVEDTPVFDWSDVADAKSYEILVDNDADFSSPEIQVGDISLSTYTPITLGNGTYSWKVRAHDNVGNAGLFSPAWTFIVENVAG